MKTRRELTPEDRATIIRLAARGISYAALSREYGVTRSAIGGIVFRFHNPNYVQPNRRATTRNPLDAYHVYRDLQPAKQPFAPDCSCPDFANDDAHCEAVNALGGFPALELSPPKRLSAHRDFWRAA